MNVSAFHGPILMVYLAGGILVGTVYFSSLWCNAGAFGRGGRVRTLIAAMAARFVLLGAVLAAASMEGAWPLLVTAGGVLFARVAVLRWAATR